jgi:hypothetical protein
MGKTAFANRKRDETMLRFEVFTAVTIKNAVSWDIKTQFIPHRKHYISATGPRMLTLCKN